MSININRSFLTQRQPLSEKTLRPNPEQTTEKPGSIPDPFDGYTPTRTSPKTSFEYPDLDTQIAYSLAASATSIFEATSALMLNSVQPVKSVGPENPDATVLVIDQFERDSDGHNHGETVVDVMKKTGLTESDIQRVEQPPGSIELVELLSQGREAPSERLDAYIELSALEMIGSTQNVISQRVEAPDSKIKTISHSIGTQALDIGFGLLRSAVDFNPETSKPKFSALGKHIFKGLGLETDLSKENLQKFHKTAMLRAHDVISNSAKVKAKKNEFNEQLGALKSKGVSYFRAAGNSNEDIAHHQATIDLNDSAAHSLLSVPNANLVGALDTKGTSDPSDDEVASFSTQDPNVMYLADGVDIESRTPNGIELTEGTSFAAPHVAAKSELARRDGLELHQLPDAHSHSSGPLAIL